MKILLKEFYYKELKNYMWTMLIIFFDILYKGNQKRTTGKTNANETSSRSHALLKINIENKDKEGPNASNISCGRFILVDLAGSEKNNSVINNNELKNCEDYPEIYEGCIICEENREEYKNLANQNIQLKSLTLGEKNVLMKKYS